MDFGKRRRDIDKEEINNEDQDNSIENQVKTIEERRPRLYVFKNHVKEYVVF